VGYKPAHAVQRTVYQVKGGLSGQACFCCPATCANRCVPLASRWHSH